MRRFAAVVGGSGRRSPPVRTALTVLAAVAAGACSGSGADSSPTTFSVPPGTEPAGRTTPPLDPLTLPGEVVPPPADRAGFSPGITVLGLSDVELAADLDTVTGLGVRWLRLDVDWPTVQADGPDSYDWRATDRVMTAARDRGLDVIGLLAYTPPWARPPGTTDKHPPLDPDRFATFAAEAARRYAPLGVHTWEIWNEPNTYAFWSPRPDPEGYADLLRRASAAVRDVDPGATVLLGGLSPAQDLSDGTEIRDRTFLRRVYESGAGDAFDAVALHPYSFPDLPSDASAHNTFAGAPAVYLTMAEFDDGEKKIWGTEFGAPTRGPLAVSEERQAEILETGYRAWAEWEFTGPLLWFGIRDGSADGHENGFGLLASDRRRKPAYERLVEVVPRLRSGSDGR